MAKNKEEVLAILRQLMPYLTERFHVARLGIFGSVARGEETETSDVDIYVELSRPLGLDFVQLGDELEEAVGVRVDLADRSMLRRLWPHMENDLVYV